MKICRLIGIITTLQQQKTATAPYLAKKFEVSRRAINRDIEDICRAGIPLVTTQERAVEWFLSFGGRVKVLHPPEMAERMKETLDAARNLYGL